MDLPYLSHDRLISPLLLPPSSVAFGMRKALMAEQGKADMEQAIKDLEEEKRELERTVCPPLQAPALLCGPCPSSVGLEPH